MFSIVRSLWEVFRHGFHPRITIQYPEEKPYLRPALSRSNHSDARSRWRRALRRLQSLRRRLPGRLHLAAGHRRRAWPPLPGVFSDQFLAMYFLRLL